MRGERRLARARHSSPPAPPKPPCQTRGALEGSARPIECEPPIHWERAIISPHRRAQFVTAGRDTKRRSTWRQNRKSQAGRAIRSGGRRVLSSQFVAAENNPAGRSLASWARGRQFGQISLARHASKPTNCELGLARPRVEEPPSWRATSDERPATSDQQIKSKQIK